MRFAATRNLAPSNLSDANFRDWGRQIPPTATIAAPVTNLSGSNTAITTTFTFITGVT